MPRHEDAKRCPDRDTVLRLPRRTRWETDRYRRDFAGRVDDSATCGWIAAMQSVAPFVLFVGFTGFIIVAAILLGRRQARLAGENLEKLAAELGLRCTRKPPVLGVFPAMPTVDGERGGRAVRFFTFTTGSGKSRQTWQACGVRCENPQGFTFQLGTQNALSRLGTILGMQDVQVGDAAFDERFVVKTNDADFLRAALLPEVRAALLRCWASRATGAHVKLDGGEVVYAESGSFADTAVVARMKAVIEPLLALAALPEVYRK
jgi:hypothetical protein